MDMELGQFTTRNDYQVTIQFLFIPFILIELQIGVSVNGDLEVRASAA